MNAILMDTGFGLETVYGQSENWLTASYLFPMSEYSE